ncbi:MAG: PD40 domain-containing protein [Bacteroidales bacterium]|nr:PD40 domain-containing protein [Bacteroidales bacterium]
MKQQILSLLAGFAALACAAAPAGNIRFASHPSLSPDRKQIYFSYDGDIYCVPSAGGQAAALLTMPGVQDSPLVSPDGKWLAFSSDIQGNNDVYVVSLAGGAAVQLTFHEAPDVPVGWSADSRYIYFESTRASARKTTFRVAVGGGTPQQMFDGFFNTVVNLTENPATGEFLFNESMESISFPTRKRYVGDHNPNIKSWNPRTKTYSELTDYIGKDQWPMADRGGTIYYVSDEANKESNIVKYVKGGKPVQLTAFDRSVQYPSIAFGGSAIVFLKDYEIHVLDLPGGTVRVPQISVASGSVEVRRSFTEQTPTAADVSPDGKKFALVIRGGLYVSDTKCKFLQRLATPADERVSEVVWGDDSKTLYYIRTEKGWTNLYRIPADGSAGETAVFVSENNSKNLTANAKRTKLAFMDGSRAVMLHDLKTGAVTQVAEAEFWSFQGYDLSFSFDDRYLAFDAMHLFEPDVFLYDLKEGKLTNLTHSAAVEHGAVFSPDGRNLYLLANPTSASFPKGTRASLYKLPLRKYDAPFKSATVEDLFKDKKDAPAKDSSVVIDFADIHERMTRVERDGSQSGLYVYSTKGKDYLLYRSYGSGPGGTFALEISDPEAKPKQIKDLSGGSFFSCKDALYCLSSGAVYKVDPGAGSAVKTAVSKDVEVVLGDEFSQMFHEAWAVLEQNYYDVNFHGTDWRADRDYYASFLPYVRTRANLRTLMTDLLGELNSSHMGFTSNGSEEKQETRIRTYGTGIVFDNAAPYKVSGILAGSPADKYGIDVRSGDRLVAVDGRRIDERQNRERYFSGAVARDELRLTFSRGGKEFDVKVHPASFSAVKTLAYKEWETQRADRVSARTGGKVGYIHMRAMGAEDLDSFLLKMHTEVYDKDALILDLRYNNGGNVHKEVIDFLRGQAHFEWSYRDFPKTSHPNVAPAGKPIVVLVNEHSLSDAEVTSNGIQTLGIAKLVGTETYRWIIFTSSVRLLDGSTVRMPAWGCYSVVTGKDLENTGVKPDIYVKNTFKDRLEGKDPQLDAAIAEVLSQLGNGLNR